MNQHLVLQCRRPARLPLAHRPSPRLNNRKFNMALATYLVGAPASMPWCGCAVCNGTTTGGGERGQGLGLADVASGLPRNKKIGKAARYEWRGFGGPIHIRKAKKSSPNGARLHLKPLGDGHAILDDVNGPMRRAQATST